MVTLDVISSPGNSPRPSNFRNQITNHFSIDDWIKSITSHFLYQYSLGHSLTHYFLNCDQMKLKVSPCQVQFLAGLIPVQLEDRIVNPDLRDHSLLGPILNPEITTGRAPYWASGAKSSSKVLFFKIQDMNPQNHILSFLLHYFDWVAALSTTCPHFCPGGLQVLFFTQEDQIASRILQFLIHQKLQDSFFFKDFYTSYEASIAALVLCFERSTGKEHFQKHSGQLWSGSGAFIVMIVVWTPLLLFCDKRVNCLFILFIFLLYSANIFCNDFISNCIPW